MQKDLLKESLDLLGEFPEENEGYCSLTESIKKLNVDFNDPVKVKFFADAVSSLIESEEIRTHLINNLKVTQQENLVLESQDSKFKNLHSSALDFL